MTTREFLEQNNDLVADYLKALNESIDYVTANVETSAESAEAKFGIAKDDFIVTWQSFNFGLGFSEEGAKHLENVGAWAFEHGKFPKEYDIRRFIDTSAAVKSCLPQNRVLQAILFPQKPSLFYSTALSSG